MNDPWFDAIVQKCRGEKSMAEAAIVQLSDDELNRRPAAGFNSVATIIRHLAGNLRSRFTDFLTTDGDKPFRDRESEFTDWIGTRSELMAEWERGFALLFEALAALEPEDVRKSVTIRSVPHTVPEAIVRALTHLSYHVGQIMYVARLVHGGEWKYLTIPPGGTNAHNAKLLQQHGDHKTR